MRHTDVAVTGAATRAQGKPGKGNQSQLSIIIEFSLVEEMKGLFCREERVYCPAAERM